MARTVGWDTTAVNENSGGTPTYGWERGAPDIQEYKTIMTDSLNDYFKISSRSGWMYNDKGMQYDGLKYVKVPILDVKGMGDYRRNQGYALNVSNLDYEQFEVKMDRSTRMSVDRLDLDETGGLTSLVNMARVQMDDWIIPEIDAYNYSAVAQKVADDFSGNVSNTDVNVKALLDTLRLERANIENEFSVGNLAYFMTPITAAYLASNFDKVITYQNFGGNLNTKVKAIDGVPIIEIPGLRFHTAYEFKEGTIDPNAVDENDLGFEVAEISAGVKAPEMLYMIAPLDAPQAFTKINVTNLETPETSGIDSWELKKRITYDCWLRKDNAELIKYSTGKLVIA